MNFLEALTVTLLGIGSVFFGLILTSFGIHIFGKLLGREKKAEESGGEALPAVPGPGEKPQSEPVPTDVVAALITTLELEKRINLSYRTSRFTFKTDKGRS